MKKTIIIASVLSFAFALSAFGKAPVLKNRADSLNYALGVVNGEGLKTYYLANDTTGEGAKSLIKGIDDGMKLNPEFMELQEIGTNIGNALKSQIETGLMEVKELPVNMELIRQGLINGMRGFEDVMTSVDANNYVETVMQGFQERELEKTYGENKRMGEEFLAQNAKNPGVHVTESGLQYKIIREGSGEKPTAASRVKVHYHGTLIDGSVFDSSVERGEPAVFGVTQVIKGWTEALQLMPVGSKWILYIPQDLAYGAQGQRSIDPFTALIFEVELISIEN